MSGSNPPRVLRRPHEQVAQILAKISENHEGPKVMEYLDEPMEVEYYTEENKFRPVIIDGLNICHLVGQDKFKAEGIQIAYDQFKRIGYEDKDIVIIMKRIPIKVKSERDILNRFERDGMLFYTPSRIVSKCSRIQSDDDLFILKTAKELDGVILSNDQYRNEKSTHPEYKEIIEKRLIQPRFIKNTLILPDDPLGKNGPNLDTFLRF